MIMSYQKPIRHGDVDLIPKKIPYGAKLISNNTVMHGENGHEHKLVSGQILIFDQRKFVKSSSSTYLIHKEHDKIPIPNGEFEVLQEEEFDPYKDTITRVRD